MAFNILSTQNLTAASANASVNDTPSGTFTASKLTVADTTPAITGGQILITEGANTETKRIISVLNGTEFVVEHLTNAYTTAALVTFMGFTNPGDPLGQTLVQGASGLKLNGSKNKAETFSNVYANDLKEFRQKAVDKTNGQFTASNLEVDTDASIAGDRGIKFWLTASTWVRFFWDNAAGLFKLVSDDGNLQRLLIADGLSIVGEIKPYAGSSAPTGYLLCDGTAVSRTTYADLFAVIGTTYGSGNGSTTFNVPDLRGRTVIGKDNMGGIAANRITSASSNGANSTTLGGVGGAQTHTLVIGEIPSISHTFPMGNTDAATAQTGVVDTAASNEYTGNTNSVGGGGAHSNTQPWIALNYLIKT